MSVSFRSSCHLSCYPVHLALQLASQNQIWAKLKALFKKKVACTLQFNIDGHPSNCSSVFTRGKERKVCQTFLRRKLQHGILLTSVQFSLENSRLSRAGSFSNTAALFQQQGHSNSCCPAYIAWRILCVCMSFILVFHLVTFVFFQVVLFKCFSQMQS